MSADETDSQSPLHELFGELLIELETQATGQPDEGIFRALGMLANTAIYVESREGSPQDSDVHEIVDHLQRSINVVSHDPITASRLIGMLDIVFDASSKLPPRLSDEEFKILQRISGSDFVPLDEVRDFVFPPSPPDVQQRNLTVFSLPSENNLVVVRRIGEKSIVEISPRGKDAISAYLNYKMREATTH